MLSLLPFCKEAPLSSRFGSYCLHFPIPAASTRASTGFLWHSPHFLPVSAHCPVSKPPCILNFCNWSSHLLVPKSVLISYCSREYTLNLSELNTNNHLLSFIWHSSFYGAGILKQLSLLVTAGSLLLCCSQDAIPDCGYSNLDMAKDLPPSWFSHMAFGQMPQFLATRTSPQDSMSLLETPSWLPPEGMIQMRVRQKRQCLLWPLS